MPTTIDPLSPIVLAHESTPLSISVLPYGLVVHAIELKPTADGLVSEAHDLVPNYQDSANHAHPNRSFFAPIIGRFANRLPAGESTFGKGVEKGTIRLEEFSGPGVALHGGPYPSKTSGQVEPVPRNVTVSDEIQSQAGPFDRLVWTPLSKPSASRYFSDDRLDAALAEGIFAIESPHGDQGYPGHLRVEARFALLRPNQSDGSGAKKSVGSIHLEYRAAILNDDLVAATPFNITHHWGFNLSASSLKPEAIMEGGTILLHRLRFVPPMSGDGIKRLGLDDQMLPTGELISIPKDDQHDFDLNGGKKFGDNMPAGGYDHYYHWGQKDASNERVHLASDATGLELSFKTNQTGTQVYTTSGQPPFPVSAEETGGARKKIHSPQRAVKGKEDAWKQQGNGQFCCAMLEFGAPHGVFLHEELMKANDAGKEDGLLRKGQTYSNFVEMEVLVKSD